ncbi:MAG: penicillin acylase family protein [Solirubrobacteraceae bacterium]
MFGCRGSIKSTGVRARTARAPRRPRAHARAAAAAAAIAVAGLLAVPAGSLAAGAPVQPYQTNDLAQGGFHDILPPGENGLIDLKGLLSYETMGTRPPHSIDQYSMYQNLLYGSPGLTADQLSKYYKDASFGVKPGDVQSTEQPRPDVTIVRDKGFGVPHVYGTTRYGTMFGLGYVAAEDKLFFMDVLRHAGRAQLSSFAGGAAGNRAMDAGQIVIAPYSEQDLQNQIDNFPKQYGAEGQGLFDDAAAYTAGVNEYINEAKLDPTKMPGEYAAVGRTGPDPWKMTDLVSIASLVGGIFGKGGGTQLAWANILQGFQSRFGSNTGSTLWGDFRSRNDPEAPTTVGQSFPYEQPPSNPAPDGEALPDPGTVAAPAVVTSATGSAAGDLLGALNGVGTPIKFDKTKAAAQSKASSSVPSRQSPAAAPAGPATSPSPSASNAATLAAWGGKHNQGPGGELSLPTSDSNALLVSAAHTGTGHPIAVMGPQVGYFDPQILMEEDVHGPGIDATGASFVGTNMVVELGHGRDYAWSATSAGQDIVHTFALDLCNVDGSAATTSSTAYIFRGRCTPMEKVTDTNTWVPNAADQTPPGSETLSVYRTVLGPVTARATRAGKPIAYTLSRTTFGHEIDSALGFRDFNNPDVIHNATDFQHAAYKIGYTFNWLYTDNKDIAYFNSGNNPIHDPRVDPILPTPAKYEWQNFNPANNTASYTPFSEHPQALNPDFLTSWNNKQAPDFNAADGFYGPIYRSQLLSDRIQAGIANGQKMSLPQLVSAMEDAGTVDLRADKNLPLLLDVLGQQQSDPQVAAAVNELAAWHADGSHRIDRTNSGSYAHSDAIAVMDAWYPLLVQGEFQPDLGAPLFSQISSQIEVDNAPNNHGSHLGSAYDNGWYGYVDKDLRDILGRNPQAPYHHVYCGSGDLAACRAMLAATLKQAIAVSQNRAQLYTDSSCASAKRTGDQECFDTIEFRATGAVSVPLMPWVNRPTFQQAVEIPSHRPRAAGTAAGSGSAAGSAPAHVCASRRRITLRLRQYHPRTTTVYVGGKRLRSRRGARARKITISLVGRPKTRVLVKIVIHTTSGKRIVLRRRYLTCTAKITKPKAKHHRTHRRHA